MVHVGGLAGEGNARKVTESPTSEKGYTFMRRMEVEGIDGVEPGQKQGGENKHIWG